MPPVHNRIANQKVKDLIVRRRDCPPHVGFIENPVAKKNLSLLDELFGQIRDQRGSP
jgi:hypothetical protein